MIVPANSTHRAQSRLIRRDREIRIFGYFSFFMHARNISECDFKTIHLGRLSDGMVTRSILLQINDSQLRAES